MPSYTFYIYNTSVLTFNPGTGEFDFSAGYTPETGLYRVDVTDDDPDMDSSGDTNQLASVYDLDGNLITSGEIAVPAYALLSDPNTSNSTFIDRIEIDGSLVGYYPEDALTPGTSYSVSTSGTFTENHFYYQTGSISAPPCFGPGTYLATPEGEKLVNDLNIGDLVETLDNGPQPVRWIGRAKVNAQDMERFPGLRPVAVRPAGAHQSDLILSGNHRVLLRQPGAELSFGTPDVLVAAQALGQNPILATHTGAEAVEYTHILFDQHEIICANGHWVESLLATDQVVANLGPVLGRQLDRRRNPMMAARLCLTTYEARALLLRPGEQAAA